MSSSKIDIFKSEKLCMKDVVEYNFTIPTYQRPYVWGDEQLKKIIDDFYKAFQSNKDEAYYISSLITKDKEENGKNSELIDGQQRFTTLWLIALVINRLTKNYKSDISQFLKSGDKIRLSFEIRNEVYNYLIYLLEGNQETKNKIVTNTEDYPYLRNIAKAIKSIDGFIKDALSESKNNLPFEEELSLFGNYIFNKVFFIKNTTPPNTDLNKLFSTINNSGVQLEQTDIVKANLLKVIGIEKVLYSKIWESCENMNNFFERNARFSFPQSDWKTIDMCLLYNFNESVFKYKAEETDNEYDINEGFNINDIKIESISEYPFNKKLIEGELDREESSEIYCRSIINFGQFLLHAYRIHLKEENRDDFEGTFHVNRLIEVFKELADRNDADEVKRFFNRIWTIRYLFDKYIIKWVSDTNTKNEALELVNFSRNDQSYYTRTPYEKKSASLMLQSVLYFTGDYLRQYWLSSYLDYLYYNHNNEDPISENHLKYLEFIDNVFSQTKNISDKELSWRLMHQTSGFVFDFNIEDYLNKAQGTGFKHYWFYKLEYVLWKNWGFEKNDEFKNFRITSKNSVEHIYPQNPENKNQHPEIGDDFLHSFGNLVLLSVSQNSEYSNKSVSVKRSMFAEKKNTYDTLKSFYIFQNNEWTISEIEQHKNDMLEKIKLHYK